ncbi:hypothetical protein [Salmonirosea aquatica]|uniref:Monoheme cytochrome C n=1 Tax=Salmonirosea aquatica TaxID=2654236 RepID=A0A7C9BER2_9BACT|nr:hypothetical protein [Cytophagaceae bacterium SJW1-29]
MKLYKILPPTLIIACFLIGAAFRADPLFRVGAGSAKVELDTTKKGLDPTTGFVIDEGIDLMRAHCTGCHSSKLITQFRATREVWLEKIRWMQRTQNLWDLGKAEPKILDYLAKHYAPADTYERRQPLKDIEWYKLEKGK